jgi:hypothetical protein
MARFKSLLASRQAHASPPSRDQAIEKLKEKRNEETNATSALAAAGAAQNVQAEHQQQQ